MGETEIVNVVKSFKYLPKDFDSSFLLDLEEILEDMVDVPEGEEPQISIFFAIDLLEYIF